MTSRLRRLLPETTDDTSEPTDACDMKLVSSAALLLSWLALLSGCRGAGEVDGPLTDVRVRHGTLTVREATDGRRQVRAVFDAADTLVDCEVGETKAGASSDIAVEKTIVGGPAVKLLHARCLQLHQTAARTRRSLLVYPGTKWCGKGSSAHFYDDLGDSRDTDMCCRAHDFCPFTISGLTSKYNLFNYRFHTLSHCDCDDRWVPPTGHGSTRCAKTVQTPHATMTDNDGIQRPRLQRYPFRNTQYFYVL